MFSVISLTCTRLTRIHRPSGSGAVVGLMESMAVQRRDHQLSANYDDRIIIACPRLSYSSFSREKNQYYTYTNRRLSTTSYNNPTLRAFPSYTIFGETCLLNLKIILPPFRVSRNNILQTEGNKKGMLLLEWVPRNVDGTIPRDQQIRFGLHPEEAGLLIDQIEKNKDVVLIRRVPPPGGNSYAPGTVVDTMPNKVLRVTPDLADNGSGQVTFMVDYEKDGVGGQNISDSIGQPPAMPLGPLQITVQLGEYQVMRQIMQSSLPALVGWTTMMDIAVQKHLRDATTADVNSGANPYGHGGYY